jgi:hypothetical protein
MDSITKSINSDVDYIYIKHVDDEKVWGLKTGGANHSILLKESIIENPNTDSYGTTESNPMSIDTIKPYTLPFIVSYMNFYDGTPEKNPPEKPIKSIHLSVIFGDEYHLFTSIYSETDSVKTKILKLNDHIEMSMYFKLQIVCDKLCSIVASILKELDITSIKKLADC